MNKIEEFLSNPENVRKLIGESRIKVLREVFRAEFRQHDFCIGQIATERLFARLLNEPDMDDNDLDRIKPSFTTVEVIAAFDNAFTLMRTEELFNRDNEFYNNLKK